MAGPSNDDGWHHDHEWWERGVLYEVYPRSFQDTNGDGVGDLPGVRRRLDYLQDLGVDAVWLTPIYPSPQKDHGYDITDHKAIDPVYGTLPEFDDLLADVHDRGMRLIMDLVPNHTSDRHPWFTESRASRDNPRRDWYIWVDPASDGGPPTNWRSVAGGSAWTYDDATGQYYYHAYLPEQPDLNWRNPAVLDAFSDIMRFWLDRGVDGFRIDVIWRLIKDEALRNDPVNDLHTPQDAPHEALVAQYSADRPEVHDVIDEFRHVLEGYDGDRMMVGEIYLPVERLVAYYGGGGRRGLHLPFNFHLIQTPWDARVIGEKVAHYEASLPDDGWPNWVLGNHDRPRLATRVGPEQARVAAMLLLTLRGTPTMYYGDELGLPNTPIPPASIEDPWERNMPGLGRGRDPVRTPMPWHDGASAGFTGGRPWLPLNPDYPTRNVEALLKDDASILNLYRRLLRLRREEPALAVGAYTPVAAGDGVLAYGRTFTPDHQAFLVALNLNHAAVDVDLPEGVGGTVVLTTGLGRDGEPVAETLSLSGDEGVIVALA